MSALATVPRPAVQLPSDAAAALYDVEIHHVRTTPLRNAFRYRSYQWLVDLDALPALPLLLRPFARFEARDHLGDPARSLRANVDAYLAENGIDLRGGRIRMLANARVLGYVFNPLTVYWCHDAGRRRCAASSPRCTTPTASATATCCAPTTRGRAETGKQFYVSPFYEVAGRYTMSLPEPGERLALCDHPAPARGRDVRRQRERPAPSRPRACRWRGLLLGRPWSTAAVSLRIRWQGIKLYLRGLPVVPRRSSSHAKGACDDAPPIKRPAAPPAVQPLPAPAAHRPQPRRSTRRRWPDVADGPRRPAARRRRPAPVQRRRSAGCALQVAAAGRRGPRRRAGRRSGDAAGASRRVLPPARRGRADRLRRGLHGGRLGRRRPDRRC